MDKDFELKGKYISRYRIDELLGAGSMAHVYKAYDSEINRTVAIKVLKKNNCLDEEYYKRFLSEAKAAGFLSHPNIVTIYDVGSYEQSPYIVMELIEGETLTDRLENSDRPESNTPFDIKATLRVMLQLAKALDYAHSKGIVHRDVKPDNIIFMPDGETVKLTDFGIAHRDDSAASEKTQAGTLLGTPRYMSPEQALGEKLDGRSDLFSLGVLLYEMLTGQKAFKSKSMVTLITQITQKQPELLGKLPDTIPAGVQHILKRLLEKKPDKRPSSGAELTESLQWELDAIYEQEQQQSKSKYIPLHVKWTILMSSLVAIVLTACIYFVLQIQTKALTEHAVDSGVSLVQFIASESSIPVLGEDWVSLESLVKDASERQTFEHLMILDHSGTVRAAMDPSLIGQPMQALSSTGLIQQQGKIAVNSVASSSNQPVFDFAAPIYFNQTVVGQIHLGLLQTGLEQIKQISTKLFITIGVVTLAAVVVVLMVFGGFIDIQLATLRRAMVDFQAGGLDRRISHRRKDEIGDLYDLFNQIADKVQNEMKPANGISPSLPPTESEADVSCEEGSDAPDGNTDNDITSDSDQPSGDAVASRESENCSNEKAATDDASNKNKSAQPEANESAAVSEVSDATDETRIARNN